MITGESAKDILDADRARRDAGREALLTPAGREVMANLVRLMAPMPQDVIDTFIRESLDRPKLQLRLA
jgi:hypothetical protein